MPAGMAQFLFVASRGRVQGRPWPILLAAAEGRARLVVQVHPRITTGKERILERSVVAVMQNELPANAVVILADSTADRLDIETLVGRPVRDITPCGTIARQKSAVQIPADVLRSTSARTVGNIVRGILAEFRPQRLGIICHRPHRKAIEGLQDTRIVRVCHFGQGPDRSDNSWTRLCDLVAVIGTPRPGPAAVRRELIRLGEMDAAAITEPVWMPNLWPGQTTDGKTVLVSGRRFHDDRWQHCFESLCRAELTQCLGRGRTILESGIPVVVVSTEAGLGLPIKPDAKRVNSGAEKAYNALMELATERPKDSDTFPNIYLLGNGSESLPVKTAAIAERSKLCPRRANGYLRDLLALGLVTRHGNAGWLPVRCVTATTATPRHAGSKPNDNPCVGANVSQKRS